MLSDLISALAMVVILLLLLGAERVAFIFAAIHMPMIASLR